MSESNENRPIESLRNLGPKSCKWLRLVGLNTVANMERIGAVVAYRLAKRQQPQVSLNLLWGLAAGLEGQDWRDLSEETKQQLLEELESL